MRRELHPALQDGALALPAPLALTTTRRTTMKIESLPLSAEQPAPHTAPRRRTKVIALTLLTVALAGAGAYALTHRAAPAQAAGQGAAPAPAAAKEPVHELSPRDVARMHTPSNRTRVRPGFYAVQRPFCTARRIPIAVRHRRT